MSTNDTIHRKQCHRWNIPGHAHCLTFSTLRRQPFFRSDRTCRWFAEALGAARDKHEFHLWGWVIMPEHVHVVIWIPADTLVETILRSIKFPMARRAIAWARNNAPEGLGALTTGHRDGSVSCHFWRPGGGHDRNLRSIADVHEKIRYLHANPVRRRLVEHPRDWAWSSWQAYELGIDEPLRLDRESLAATAK